MKKLVCAISVLCFMAGILIFPHTTVWAAGLGISVSASSVNVGDTITATVSVPSGYGATVAVAYDSSVLELTSSSGNGALLNLGDAMGQPSSGTVTFKAVGAGSCTISAASTVAGDANGEPVNLDGASTGITVANAVTEPENPGGNNGDNGGNTGNTGDNGNSSDNGSDNEPVLSADNSLASLVLSAGELSPAFSYSTTKYTAVVDYNVINIAITAKTSHAKAQIVSVSGNENLVVGENTIEIVVKAENGVTAKYVITVTRKPQDESGNADNGENNQPDSQLTDEFVINGATLKPAGIIPDDVVPVDFTEDSIELAGVEYPCLKYNFGAVTLLYFVEEDADNGALYVYDQSAQMVYPYIRLNSEAGYILILIPSLELVDETWKEISLTLEGKGIADVFHAPQQPEDFYLVYAMNQKGEQGWYQYDSAEGTYQRYMSVEESYPVLDNPTDEDEYEYLKEGYLKLNEELEQTKQKSKLYIGILAAIIAVLFIGIVILLVLSKNGHVATVDEDELFDDGDSDEEDIDDAIDGDESEDEDNFDREPAGALKEELSAIEALEEGSGSDTEEMKEKPKEALAEVSADIAEEQEAAPVDITEEKETTPDEAATDDIAMQTEAVVEDLTEDGQQSPKAEIDTGNEEDDDLKFIDL